jgi:hypothetical protein
LVTTRRRRGSRTLNRLCIFLTTMASRITLRLNNTDALETICCHY